MSFGTTSVVINASRFKILRGATEVTLASDVKVKNVRTVDRINTRAGAIDTPRWVLQELEFTAALTEALLTQVQSDAAIGAQANLLYNNWTVNGVDLSGAAPTSDIYSCALVDYEELGPENGITLARIKLRVAAGAL